MIFLVCMEDRMEKKTKFASEWKNPKYKSIRELREGETNLVQWEKMGKGCKKKVCRSCTGRVKAVLTLKFFIYPLKYRKQFS